MKYLTSSTARLIMVIASFVGFFASVYLLYAYVTGAPITCGLVKGCDIVRSSKWAYTFGIPRPLLGVIFYVGLFALLVLRAAVQDRSISVWLFRLTQLAAVLGFIESAFLFGVQWFDLRAFCLWCLISAVASTGIMIAVVFDKEETSILTQYQELKRYLISFLVFIPSSLLGLWKLIR